MDQIKPFIQWCKINIFWIGCFFLAATMIGTWVYSAYDLAGKQAKGQSDIKKQLSALKRVSGTTAEPDLGEKAHANDSTQEGMNAEINTTIDSIVRAWTKRYKEQKKILTWPEDVLGKETCDFFSKIDVPEKVSDPGRGFEKYRKAYYDKVPLFMDQICRKVGINWQYDKELLAQKRKEAEEDQETNGGYGGGFGGGMGGPGGPGFGGGAGGEDETAYIDEMNKYPVVWEQENQTLWYRKLTEFSGYDDHRGASLYPTFMQANMLQQDLWLLDAMFNNIKEINGASTSNDTSVIQIVDHIVFGREAINQLGELSEIDGRLGEMVVAPGIGGAGVPGDGGMMDDPGSAYGAAYGGGGYGPGAAFGGQLDAAALAERIAYHNRYVDPNFESIKAADVKAVLGGSTLPETNLELIVAKRVPFRIAVEMDERKINEFIAICGNSEFMFEINQLRVNRHLDFPGAIEFNGGSASSSPGGGGKLGQGGLDMPGMGGGGGGSAPSGKLEPTMVESRTDFMVSVEFYGVVKIYNPVRENFLRLAAGQNVVDETADPTLVAAPAAVPAAAQPVAAQPAAGQPAAAQPDAGANPATPAEGATPDAAAPAEGQPAQDPAPAPVAGG